MAKPLPTTISELIADIRPPQEKPPTTYPHLASDKEKLAADYRYVKIPDHDIYDYAFDGIWINQTHYKPGTHLLHPDIANEIEMRLERWNDSMIRLLQNKPKMGTQSQRQANRRGAEIDPTPELR